jgi:hypothetical protein
VPSITERVESGGPGELPLPDEPPPDDEPPAPDDDGGPTPPPPTTVNPITDT